MHPIPRRTHKFDVGVTHVLIRKGKRDLIMRNCLRASFNSHSKCRVPERLPDVRWTGSFCTVSGQRHEATLTFVTLLYFLTSLVYVVPLEAFSIPWTDPLMLFPHRFFNLYYFISLEHAGFLQFVNSAFPCCCPHGLRWILPPVVVRSEEVPSRETISCRNVQKTIQDNYSEYEYDILFFLAWRIKIIMRNICTFIYCRT